MGRRNDRRPDRRRTTNRSSSRDKIHREDGATRNHSPRSTEQSRELRQLLAGIGRPEATSFKADPFQLDALAALEFEDVLVTAPTGSGKTWIAREEIRRLIESGRRAWYTTPLKALTNSKYEEFGNEFGPANVGILT